MFATQCCHHLPADALQTAAATAAGTCELHVPCAAEQADSIRLWSTAVVTKRQGEVYCTRTLLQSSIEKLVHGSHF